MNEKQQQKLDILLKILEAQKPISPKDVEKFLGFLVQVVKQIKVHFDSVSREKLEEFNRAISRAERLTITVDDKNGKTKREIDQRLVSQIQELRDLCEEVRLMRPENGKDADEDSMIEAVYRKLEASQSSKPFELTGAEIVQRINALPEEFKISASHVDGSSKSGRPNGGGWRNLAQMHDVLFTDPVVGDIPIYDGEKWVNTAFDNNGILSLNGLSDAIQTFAVGTSGNDFNIVSAASVHTFNIPTASAVNRGALSSTDWSTFNAKQNAITGNDTEVLFFDGANNPAGHSGFKYDKTTGTLTIDNIASSITNSFTLVGDDNVFITATGGQINLTGNGSVRFRSSPSGNFGQLDATALTTVRNFAFQDADGTLAFLSDIPSLSGYVPYTGATADVDLGTFDLLTDSIRESAGANIDIDVKNAQLSKSTRLALDWFNRTLCDSSGNEIVNWLNSFKIKDVSSGFYAKFLTSTLSADRDFTFPDQTGTLALVSDLGSYVQSVTGTASRITSTGGQNPVIDIDTGYVGQTSITTLGTITTGVWNGTAIANANLANSAITIGSTAISLGASSTTLAGLTSVTSTTFVGALTGNASTATTLQTARTIGIATGDVTSAGSSFNGGANNTNAYTLATVNANVGTFGSATQSVQFTVNGKGLITAAANVTVTPAVGSITGLGTGVATALAVNVGSAGAFVVNGGALGTPSSGTVTNLTGTASININGTVGATTPAAGTFTAAIANSFVPNSSTIPTNGMYLPAANTLGWSINSAAELRLTSTALFPASNDGLALGVASTGEFSDLFLAEGGVINWDNGDMSLTQVGNMLTVAGGDFTTPNITISAMTAGSMLFAGTGGLVAQDNAEVFWNDSTNMMGIGTNSPQRKLHILSNSSIATTILALDNPNTTNGNAVVQSFRTTTTGVGATAFTEIGAIRFQTNVHDHATHDSEFNIYSAIAGTLTEVMTNQGGRLGLRQTTPTATLHLKAGVAAASGAPLKFAAGTNLTTAETGAVEYDGTLLHFTPTGTIRKNIPTLTCDRQTAKTAAIASLATHTVGGTDRTYRVSANVLVTTSTSHNFTVTVAYTDEGNTARTATLNFSLVAGGALTTAIRDAAGAVPYMGIPQHIRCKAGSTITIATTGTFTTVTYNAEGMIELIA